MQDMRHLFKHLKSFIVESTPIGPEMDCPRRRQNALFWATRSRRVSKDFCHDARGHLSPDHALIPATGGHYRHHGPEPVDPADRGNPGRVRMPVDTDMESVKLQQPVEFVEHAEVGVGKEESFVASTVGAAELAEGGRRQ